MYKGNLILASGSPRRKELLELTRIPFTTLQVPIDETFDPQSTVEENLLRIAEEKARAALQQHPDETREATILSADTAVVYLERPLGKPRDREHAIEMLNLLEGIQHQVMTAFAILGSDGRLVSDIAVTTVEFLPMSAENIEYYIDTMQPFDKAGAYGIQDPIMSCFVKKIEGCYYNVVGLPLSRVYATLQQFSA
ncbi:MULTISPECIES: Maf family protein [Prosthecochloris]|uniref:dTTP/UTP pyrophosphatase n=1 Tax=Prosthecochloris vibrioformis TaxID=1098 RepID=A0A5C4S023_PROVB|nr:MULTISPECIES: Maf family protein [Prosthecochloris]ANT65078.1 Maf-like protein YhdE [Prosthecochloris sp. CIB 2401]TNJ36863.1 septum formation protein Maf [Prosthecochloris vibrioformis]